MPNRSVSVQLAPIRGRIHFLARTTHRTFSVPNLCETCPSLFLHPCYHQHAKMSLSLNPSQVAWETRPRCQRCRAWPPRDRSLAAPRFVVPPQTSTHGGHSSSGFLRIASLLPPDCGQPPRGVIKSRPAANLLIGPPVIRILPKSLEINRLTFSNQHKTAMTHLEDRKNQRIAVLRPAPLTLFDRSTSLLNLRFLIATPAIRITRNTPRINNIAFSNRHKTPSRSPFATVPLCRTIARQLQEQPRFGTLSNKGLRWILG